MAYQVIVRLRVPREVARLAAGAPRAQSRARQPLDGLGPWPIEASRNGERRVVMDLESTTRLSARQLARLLELGIAGESAKSQRGSIGPIELWLETPWPLGADAAAELPKDFERLCRRLNVAPGSCLADILCDPKTSLNRLEAIKQFFKGLSNREASKAQRSAAVAVYYAAIASALLFHGRTITRLREEQILRGLTGLVGESWVSPELRDLFDRTRALLEDRGSQPPRHDDGPPE